MTNSPLDHAISYFDLLSAISHQLLSPSPGVSCYSMIFHSVAEGNSIYILWTCERCRELSQILPPLAIPMENPTASDLLSLFVVGTGGGSMTRTQWLLLGAVLLGLAVGLYILFFCPTECH